MTSGPSSLERQADAAARAGRPAEARRLLEAAVRETPQRLEAWTKLAAMCRALGDLAAGLEAISRALTIDPLDFFALLAKASLLEKMDREEAAGEAYGHALAQRSPTEPVPPEWAPVVAHAESRYRQYQQRRLAELRAAVPPDSASSGEEQARIDRFCSNIARVTEPALQQPTHFHFPGLAPIEFHDRSHFPWLAELEAATDDIRNEFHALIDSEAAQLVPYVQYADDQPLRQWRALNQSRDWTAVHLLQNGRRIEENARHCPATMALLASFPQPQVPGYGPNAMFSLLAPRTRIPPHTGVANTRLVCHLPLIVPPGCGFRVGAETRLWQPGEAFVFDDTIEHEAWNDSDELRVVLIFDLWAWMLTERERQAVSAIMIRSGVGEAESL